MAIGDVNAQYLPTQKTDGQHHGGDEFQIARGGGMGRQHQHAERPYRGHTRGNQAFHQ